MNILAHIASNPNSVAGWDARVNESLEADVASGPVRHDVVMLRDAQVPELSSRNVYMHPPVDSETAQNIRERTGALVMKREVPLHGRNWTHLFVREVLGQESYQVLDGINEVLAEQENSAGPLKGLPLEPEHEEFRLHMQELNRAA